MDQGGFPKQQDHRIWKYGDYALLQLEYGRKCSVEEGQQTLRRFEADRRDAHLTVQVQPRECPLCTRCSGAALQLNVSMLSEYGCGLDNCRLVRFRGRRGHVYGKSGRGVPPSHPVLPVSR